ncbi:hypothetical protein GCM10011387_12100 [Pedobacter quisquiliarum]|uniref:DinB-like domain-containing protein n=2 Tax=Pedobacter quisquiliarum TaxID=1834438 RepID=A0A916XBR0_9SPHI|nr:hypothetical protein GCM10011387_12100 [Pedobacter quisquiliarum]
MAMDNNNQLLVAELEKLLRGGTAHVGFEDATAGLDEALLAKVPENLPYSIWQLVEHIRIAQADMLDFCRNPSYQALNWPDDYWPKEVAPKDNAAFEESVQAFAADLEAFIQLLRAGDLYTPFPHGDGQTLLREALQLADHTAYHVAEIVVIRRLLQAWPPAK